MEEIIAGMPAHITEATIRQRKWKRGPGAEMERRYEDMSESASQKFENLIDAALYDGILTESEAVMLVQEHNDMQHQSREALREKLDKYGHTFYNKQINNYDMAYPRSGPEPKMGHHKKSGSTDIEDGLFVKTIMDVGDAVTRPSRNMIFVLIVGLTEIIVFAKLFGAI